MIDFKKLAKQSGQTAWLHTKLPTIPALVSVLPATGPDVKCMHQVEVEFEIKRGEGNLSGWWIQLHGGPTGYESCDLIKLLENTETGAKWIACMGSANYRRMEIRIDNIRHAIKNYAVNYRFELL